MDEELRFKVVTWNEIIELSLTLAQQVKEDEFSPKLVIGILKGGAVVSRVVADVLGQDLYTIRVRYYQGIGRRGEAEITQGINFDLTEKQVVLVDDVVDTGKTLSVALEYLQREGSKGVKTAVIHQKPWSKLQPEYWLQKTKKWIVYPWEYYEFLRLGTKKLNSDLDEADKQRLRNAMEKVRTELRGYGKEC